MSREVTCYFRLNLKIGRTSVKPSWKHWIFTGKYHCLHTGVPYNRPYGWNRPNVKAQCSLFTFSPCYLFKSIRSMFSCYTRKMYISANHCVCIDVSPLLNASDNYIYWYSIVRGQHSHSIANHSMWVWFLQLYNTNTLTWHSWTLYKDCWILKQIGHIIMSLQY